ncbi:MAG: hypothetical protein PPP58_02740 [Natronomonas sp.]
MSLRRLLSWPVVALAGWIDEYPIRAAALVVALGGTGVLFVPAAVTVEAGLASIRYEGVAPEAIVDAARERPVFAAASIIGCVVAVVYDG